MVTDSTKRFSSRVENYVKYRPGYPQSIISLLQRECGLNVDSVVADIGSGTGISTEVFLANGNPVFGIEPNLEMREAAEKLLNRYPRFKSIAATAEATTLPSQSIDLVVAGQAFHWFNREQTRVEFCRILKPGGWVALIWNDRKTIATPFLNAYEELLQNFATDYGAVNHKNITPEVIASFFTPDSYKLSVFENEQVFDYAGLKGRLLSSSYAPEAGQPKHEPMIRQLETIFNAHQENGTVTFAYDTSVFYGQLSGCH